MNERFAHTLGSLRREKGVSQRQAAKDLGVSQALLSHYENGLREPGLTFVVRACDYYGASADYLLGRTEQRAGTLTAPDRTAPLVRALVRAGREDPALGELLRRVSARLTEESD